MAKLSSCCQVHVISAAGRLRLANEKGGRGLLLLPSWGFGVSRIALRRHGTVEGLALRIHLGISHRSAPDFGKIALSPFSGVQGRLRIPYRPIESPTLVPVTQLESPKPQTPPNPYVVYSTFPNRRHRWPRVFTRARASWTFARGPGPQRPQRT